MKWSLSACLSYLDPNMRGEMKWSLSVCLSHLDSNMRRGRSGGVVVKFLACRSRVKGFNSQSRYNYLLLPSCNMAEISLKRRKSSIQPTNMRSEMKRLSVCLTWIPIWGVKKVGPSCLDPNIGSEIKCSLSICLSYQYEGWKTIVHLSWIPIRK